MLTASKERDERGAYAVLYALFSVLLFGVAALGVDLGNAISRKSDIQGQADFAALAGGAKLTSAFPTSVPIQVADSVADSLNVNEAGDRECDPCVTGTNLLDGSLANGEIQLTAKGMRVVVPPERVDYGFARVLDQTNVGYTDLQTSATVQIFSPGSGAMPMYAAAGCDFGLQTLTDPATGHVSSTHGNLAAGDDASDARVTVLSPDQVALNASPSPAFSVFGTDFAIAKKGQKPARKVTRVGFFLNDGSTLVSSPVDAATAGATQVSIASIPAGVVSVEAVWWVRVWLEEVDDTGAVTGVGAWSPEDDAEPLRVGSAQLECEAGSSDGNFGTLRLPRTDVPTGDDLGMNIATSFQAPLSLVVHQQAVSGGLCSDGVNGAVESDHTLKPGTNCVGTDPGLAANAAAAGLIEGVGSTPGRLTAPTSEGCGSDVTVTLHRSYSINNDTLECFLTAGATVTSITSPTYSGPSVLREEIYTSPRFFWVPVLGPDPDRGTSDNYSIIDFRPAFLTTLVVDRGSIEQIKVVFFNWKALPARTDGAVQTYFGVGPKILRLVD